MLNIIYGSNRGYKREVLHADIQDKLKKGECVYLIVPEQTVLENERALCENEALSLNLYVVSFRRLCNLIFRKYGGLSYNYISKAGKHAAMWRAVKELSLSLDIYSEGAGREIKLLTMLISAYEQLGYDKIDADMLKRASQNELCEPELSKKLSELSEIFALYSHIVSTSYTDPANDITAASEQLSKSDFFSGAHVYVDGFYGITYEELSLLELILKQCKQMYFTLGCEKNDRREFFERVRKTDSQLRKVAAKHKIEVLESSVSKEMDSDEIAFLSKNLWNFNGKKYPEKLTKSIEIYKCENRQNECETLAAFIKNKVIYEGASYADFTVLAKDVKSYKGAIYSAFERHEIPFFMSDRTNINAKSQTRLILSALSVKVSSWGCEQMLTYLKSGLCVEDDALCDSLCEYISMWKISGKNRYTLDDWRMNPEGLGASFTKSCEERLEKLNCIRKEVIAPLEEFFEVFDSTTTVQTACLALFQYLERMELGKKIEKSANRKRREGRVFEADEETQLWNSIMNLLDTLVTICGDVKITADEFYKLLSLMLDNTDIGKIPSKTDEVTFSGADMFRGESERHVCILGLNEGIFPASPSKGGIFKDSEREALENLELNFLESPDEQLYEDMLSFYNCATTAKESLTLFYSGSLRQSMCVKGVCELFENVKILDSLEIPEYEKITSKLTALEYTASRAGKEDFEGFRKALEEHTDSAALLDSALSSALVEGKISLSNEVTALIYKDTMQLSQSKIDQYVNCPFAHYCKYILKISPPGNADFESRDIGNYVHAVLERFMRAVSDRNFAQLKESEIEQITSSVIKAYREEIIVGSEAENARTDCLFDRLEGLSRLMIKNLVDEFSNSDFRPTLFEHPVLVSSADEGIFLPLDNGTNVTMKGNIDRVDTYKMGDDIFIRVVDYKTGKKSFSMSDIEKGLNLQMLIYLFTLCKSPDEGFKTAVKADESTRLHPAGVLYFLAGAPSISLDAPINDKQLEIGRIMQSIKRSGVLIDDINVLDAMERGLAGKYLPIRIKKDGELTAEHLRFSEEEFEQMRETLTAKVKEISEDMASGRADALPYKDKKNDACKYCDMKFICRHSQNEDDDDGESEEESNGD